MPSDSIATAALCGPASLDDPLYYLHNFRWVLNWVHQHYAALLSAQESRFATDFQKIPTASQGLLVRMIMRRGEHFRGDKLQYSELGPTDDIVRPLVEQGWVTAAPGLDIDTLFHLFTWPELRSALSQRLAAAGVLRARKAEALAVLQTQELPPATPKQWGLNNAAVYRLNLMPLCDRLRVMFFGNLHQDWSEFVLTELGTYAYETVAFNPESRPFHSRAEVDAYLALQHCRDSFYQEAPLQDVVDQLPRLPGDNPWLVRSRDKLLYRIAREWERAGDFGHACELYQQSSHPEARCRLMRVLEKDGEYNLALTVAEVAQASPVSEAEHQHLQRLIPRLQRKLGMPVCKQTSKNPVEEINLTVPFAPSVERAVQTALTSDNAPVYYVENTLFTGLFGLLCWDAVFAALPGAFFHPFQRGPLDLHWPDFYSRRRVLFDNCLARLDAGTHVAQIQTMYSEKYGLQSPFVQWGSLTPELLEQALQAIPAAHLRFVFERFLRDIKANCAGLPDLIQLWPEERRYRLIEVKGPGDRLQDNQRRWLEFFATHQLPAAVCYVEWAEGTHST